MHVSTDTPHEGMGVSPFWQPKLEHEHESTVPSLSVCWQHVVCGSEHAP
jgi:hypothetical protein